MQKMLRLLFILALVATSVFNAAPMPLATVVNAQSGPDLYIKDTPLDTGVEPNPDTGPMWVTEDIWVRTTPDPGYRPDPFPEASPPWAPLPHENPEYRDPKYSRPNYVYVRVRNRGTTASTGAEQLKLYWAKASTGLAWPTQWVDYMANNCGPTKLYGAEITKPRKNAATATLAERDAYRNAVLAVGTQPAFVFPGGRSYWHKQDEVHEFGPSSRHNTPAFLPWHREFINRYEALLQEVDPRIKLLYWDWTTDPENSGSASFNFFTPTFMGASGRGTGGITIGAPFLPGLAPPAVTRNLGASTTPPALSDVTLLGSGVYPTFWSNNETGAHNGSHGYIGGGGNMSSINRAAEDPFFFLLHTNADRLWAQWQRNPTALARLAPATAYDTSSSASAITTAMGPWDGTGASIRPWTTGDGYIVSKSPLDPSVVSPPIYDTAPLVIPALQPGEAVVLQIPWYPPNPADFGCFGGDQGHICLLGRVETANAPPFGMTTPEGADVFVNTKNNNNIAWKNITVVDNFPGALGLTSILVRNVFSQTVQAGLLFANTDEIGASFFDFGSIQVDLKPELFQRWQEGGGIGQGIETVVSNTIQIFSPGAFIQNIRLEPQETFSVDVRFELFKNYQAARGVLPKWDLIQMGAPDNPNATVGGQRFTMDFQKLVLVPAGGEWRYLDDGSNPGANWLTSDFDDSTWKLGRTELGFGDDPVTTIDGGPPDQRHITTYFRHTFEVTDPGLFHSLLLRLQRDDGAVVYLNGTEIHRVNLPADGVKPETLATREVSGLEEDVSFPISPTVDISLLRLGPNVIAVEIHQDSAQSPDLSFDLELAANPVITRFPPDVAFAAPMNGALFQPNQVISLTVEAVDSDGQVKSVSLFADGSLLGADDQAPYAFQLQGAALGVHQLRAVATDNDQEQATVDHTITIVDNVPPLVELTAPADNRVFQSGETIQLAAQASDPGGAVRRVEFYVRDAELFTALDQLAGSATAPPYQVDISDLAPGHYMLTAIATDDHGATGQSIPVHIEVQHSAETHTSLPIILK